MAAASSSDAPPSYSDSISSPQPTSLPQNIAQARAALVSSLVKTHISPHLYGSTLAGLSSIILLLVPANVSSLQPQNEIKDPSGDVKFRGESIEGFFSAENLTIVRLHGRENSIEFWRQPAVIRELEQQLRAQLSKDGHRVVRDDIGTSANSPSTAKPAGFFGKKPSSPDWKMPVVEALSEGAVRAAAEVKDICLRIENDMGLYETRTGKAILVKVEVGE
ncbi:hypothetical protein MMC21_001213 [Puttea exsequens]|nr:hypothetical protein [Puttea exsequens]